MPGTCGAGREPHLDLSASVTTLLREFLRPKLNPWNLLLAAGALACMGTASGFLGRLWWVFDLASHFRLQYAVTLTLLALAWLARQWTVARPATPDAPTMNDTEAPCSGTSSPATSGQADVAQASPPASLGGVPSQARPRGETPLELAAGTAALPSGPWRTAALFAVAAILNWAVIIPYAWTGRLPAAEASATLRVLQLNVHTGNRQHGRARDFIREANADVVVLEEVDDAWMADLAQLRAEYPHALHRARGDNFGIALFSRLPLEDAKLIDLGEADVPSVSAVVRLDGRRIAILGTHPLPPTSTEYAQLRDDQLHALAQVARNRALPLILLGDLNTTVWSPHFRDLLRDGGLVDSARGFGWQTTWPAGLWPLRIAIDHCLLSPDLRVTQRTIGRPVGSDHLPLLLEIAVTK
jgi:endonuclease/exonuclease/phosphatase (EEP) superfamily protein YafD